MSRRAPAHLVQPVALAVGLLEDGGRALFLYQEPAPGAAAGGGGRAARAEAGAGGRLLELPSVLVMPGERVKIIKPFKDYKGLFMVHCHNLEHEDMGMMREFLVE